MTGQTFYNIDELQPYYDKDSDTYDLTSFDEVVFEFNLYTVSNIHALKIDARIIKANNIVAKDIIAGDMDVADITAEKIYVGDIRCGNAVIKDLFLADNICASNIDAKEISYHAFCFAYNDIHCQAIEGRLYNSKHFTLHGIIDIDKYRYRD